MPRAKQPTATDGVHDLYFVTRSHHNHSVSFRCPLLSPCPVAVLSFSARLFLQSLS